MTVGFGLLCAALSACSHLKQAQSKETLPGITVLTETQTNPPLHLFIAEVDLTNPRVHVRVAPGGPDPDGSGPWQTVLMPPTKIAARDNFALVVNGDFFNVRRFKDAQGTKTHPDPLLWGSAVGPAETDGKIWSSVDVARPCLVIHKDRTVTIEKLKHPAADDWQVVSGNVLLVTNGVMVNHTETNLHPRTCVGLNAQRTKLILLVADGRKPGVSMGMTYKQLAAKMLQLGCSDAMNLDGGGSTMMGIRDEATGAYRILNTPSDGHERPVADVVGISLDPPRFWAVKR